MKTEDLKRSINNIIENTFELVQEAYKHNEAKPENIGGKWERTSTRLIFPKYGEPQGNKIRISEQELRFAFVEAFNQYCNNPANRCNLFYSVETPTLKKYSGFSKKGETPKENEKGRSAEFDLVIYNENLKRVCLIEFKAKNANEKNHWKDFVKLNNEHEGDENVLRYLIEILKSYNNTTINNIKEKLSKNKCLKASYICYSLEDNGMGHDITNQVTNNK